MLIHNEAIVLWQRGYIKMSFVEFLAVEFNSTYESSAMNPNLKQEIISTLLIVLSQLSAALLLNAQLASIVNRSHRKRRRNLVSLLDVAARVERIGSRQPGKSRRFWVRPGRKCLVGQFVAWNCGPRGMERKLLYVQGEFYETV